MTTLQMPLPKGFLRRLPNLQDLANGFEHADKLEEFIGSLNSEIDELERKRSKLEADLARLEEEKTKKFHEVGSIVPEAEAHARTIIEGAETKAGELVREAASTATKIRKDADEYNQRVIARVSKIREELS